MPLNIAMPLAISAVKALLRFRDQVDSILSLSEATTGLPFALPPAPPQTAPFQKDMLAFFQSPQGGLILQLKGQQDLLTQVLQDPTAVQGPANSARLKLFDLYFEATGVQPRLLGPVDPTRSANSLQASSARDSILAFYIVQSQRLSNNTPLVRVLLATADTLLEFAGENATVFISNPQKAALVQELIQQFTKDDNFNDLPAEQVFKSLLGSTVVAFADHPPGSLSDKPALKALFASLADVRKNLGLDGNNFVAGIVSVQGFEQLIAAYAGEVAKDPSFITNNELARQVLTATLTQIHDNFPQIVNDPKALLGVLEAGIGAAANNVATLLQKQLGGQPLVAAVLTAVLKQVGTLAGGNQLFTGQVLPDIYKATLLAIAANPILAGDQNGVNKFVSDLVVGLANALAQQQVTKLFTTETLKVLASESLTVLATEPGFLAGNNQFATKLLAAVFQAGAVAVSDGLSKDDLIDLATAAIKASADNIGLLKLNDQLAAAITSAGNAIAAAGLKQLVNAQGRKALLLSVLQAIAANPTVWGKLQAANLIQPLVQAILQGLATDPTQLLSGPVLVVAVSGILQAAVRRGQQLVDQKVQPDAIKNLLKAALERANQEVGKTVDGENLPVFLERVVAAFLDSPFDLTDLASADFQKLVNGVLAGLNG